MTSAISIERLYEQGGGDLIELEARGHVDLAEFLAAAREEVPHLGGRLCQPFHGWRRSVPAGDGEGMLHVEAKPGSRGAFRVTVCEVRT